MKLINVFAVSDSPVTYNKRFCAVIEIDHHGGQKIKAMCYFGHRRQASYIDGCDLPHKTRFWRRNAADNEQDPTDERVLSKWILYGESRHIEDNVRVFQRVFNL